MPIYEYQCTKCGQVTELMQKLSDAPLRRCKACRGKVEKLISRTSFHLKGGGWYAHGYSDASSAPAGGDKGKKAGTSGESSSKSDAKKKKSDPGAKAAAG